MTARSTQATQGMFDHIAPRYDLLNRILSGGLDQRWRRRVVAEVVGAPPGPRLDLCAGTLDLAALLCAAFPAERVVAVDLATQMMARGLHKAPRAETLQADVCDLPLDNASFGAAVCGFGVRNVASPEAFAHEVKRVLVPGGRLVVLEAFRPARRLATFLHRAYVGRVFPMLGAILSRDRDAYEYFVRSVRGFMTRAALEDLLRTAGFRSVRGYDVTLGMAGVVVAEAPS
jgi:ubiquinone/menaquinone biosynthesis methyltransferase